jgi:hypothetical protein
MRDLAAATARLRKVRRAHDEFLMRWALDCLIAQRDAIDRVNDDLRQLPERSSGSGQSPVSDWSMLYRGSVLDD